MAEAPAPTIGTVHFERKVQVRQYEAATASIFMQFEVDPDVDTTLQNAKDAMAQSKALVFEELGLKFTVDDGGYVRELLDRHLGPTTEVGADESSEPQERPARAAATARANDNRRAAPSGGGNRAVNLDSVADRPDWLAACADCDGVEFWDNRAKIVAGEWKETSPHFKCARKDCGKAVWPPRKGGK